MNKLVTSINLFLITKFGKRVGRWKMACMYINNFKVNTYLIAIRSKQSKTFKWFDAIFYLLFSCRRYVTIDT